MHHGGFTFVLKNETCASHYFSIKSLASIIEKKYTNNTETKDSPTENSYASIFFLVS